MASSKGDPCNYITGKLFVPTSAFTEKGIEWAKTYACREKKFNRPRNKKIYTPPHILIKANIGRKKLLTYFSNDYMVFKDKIIGIHAPESDKKSLKRLYDYFDEYSDTLRFYIGATSGQIAINRATAIIKEDIMNSPYPENFIELNISAIEKILIMEILSRFFDSKKRILIEKDISALINKFSDIFCKTLNSVYQSGSNAFRLFKILNTGKYFALHFEYSNDVLEPMQEQIDNLEQYIQKIIPTEKEKGKSSHTQRIFKAYGRDRIILVKPKQLRYWLPSIALRDADETFAEYLKARYQNVKR